MGAGEPAVEDLGVRPGPDDPTAALLAALARLVERLPSEPPGPDDPALRLAVAVLLVQAVRADHRVLADEHRSLGPQLARLLGLPAPELERLLRLAEEQAYGGRSLADCVAVVARAPLDLRRKVVHGLWRVVLADAELSAHEEYLVRKIAELLGLSTADLVETKLRARQEFLEGEGA